MLELPIGIVTTGSNGGDLGRVQQVSEATGWPVVVRRGALPSLLAGRLGYVVTRADEHITDGSDRLTVDRGLLHAKTAEHPLIRALGPCRRVLDGTLGLGGDAMHIAKALGCEVEGAEASPVVHALVSAGLGRLGVGSVRPHAGLAQEVVKKVAPVDAVFLAPMFRVPIAAAPGFHLFRRIADHRPFDLDFWRDYPGRVVIRVEKGDPAPLPAMTAVRGKAVDYWVSLPTGG